MCDSMCVKNTKVCDAFTNAFSHRTKDCEAAIESLDLLNEQILEWLLSPHQCKGSNNEELAPRQRAALNSSVALMRRLLTDAQINFRKMVEDNKQLASRIDGDITSAQEEVSQLRQELHHTSKKLDTIADEKRCDRCSGTTTEENQVMDELAKLRDEHEELVTQNRNLQKEIEELRLLRTQSTPPQTSPKSLETELTHAKEALSALKTDRKRLKAEKFELLNQMKQLYGTLEDKERELRDFIRNYEQRMKESDESLRHLAMERDETEREKWNILKHARDEAERCVTLSAQLTSKEGQLHMIQDELREARRRLAELGYYSDQDSITSKSNAASTINGGVTGGRSSSDRDTTGTGGNLSDSTASQEGVDSSHAEIDASIYSTFSQSSRIYARVQTKNSLSPVSHNGLSRSAEHLSGLLDKRKVHRRSAWGSISRVFSRRKPLDISIYNGEESLSGWSSPPTSPLPTGADSYSEKLRLLEEARGLPMVRWRAATVAAWLELSLGMGRYSAACQENIRSGKVLLELSDSELETGLGITHPLHRKKLRLAIEEHREPILCRYPKAGALGHLWVASEWLPDMGLPQYSESFCTHLVDGRMLEYLSKKELEKHLGVSRKFHQVSILHGIQLLRMLKYDRQILAERRQRSEEVDADPLVWTCQRFISWSCCIDLTEYADNLKDSGVHGALVVLESSFNSDTMATALGIPQSKHIIRRHLQAQMDSLVLPARALVEEEAKRLKSERRRAERLAAGGSLGRSFSRSLAPPLQPPLTSTTRPRSSLRGSLSRALGLKVKSELNRAEGETSSTHRRIKSIGDIDTITVTPV